MCPAWKSRIHILSLMLLPLALVTASCNEPAGLDVSSAYGSGMKLDGLGPTYAWAPASLGAGEQFRPQSPEVDAMLKRIIEEQLAKKGFSQSPSGTPDFLLRDGVFRETKTDSSVSPFGVPYEKGSLFVDALNPTDGKLIWRGVAQARLDESAAPLDRERLVTTAVGELFKKFPARTGAKP